MIKADASVYFRSDLLPQYQNLSIEEIMPKHFKNAVMNQEDIQSAAIILFVDETLGTSIIKNRYGMPGVIGVK